MITKRREVRGRTSENDIGNCVRLSKTTKRSHCWMNYIIFGAGQTGINAMRFLDYWRVACFADNFPHEPIENKKVVSYETMLDMVNNGDYIIVVASARYNADMVAQLKADGVTKYFVYHDAAPGEIIPFYPSYRLHRQTMIVPYVKVLTMMGIEKYKKIAIYGDNFFLPYLISEIAVQVGFDKIVGISKFSSFDTFFICGLTITISNVFHNCSII